MASLLTERCYRSTPRGVLTAHAWWLCQCETGACQYHWCSIYRGLERVGSWVPGGSVGRDQLAMAAKVRRHWFNPCRLGSRGHLGADFSLLLYTDLIKKRKPSRHITDEGELIRNSHRACTEGKMLAVTKNRTLPFSKACPNPLKNGLKPLAKLYNSPKNTRAPTA